MNPPSSLIHHTQQQFDDPPNVVGKTSTAASDKILRRPLGNNGNGNESALISMRRKHRSLDGSQFLSRFDGSSVAYEASTAGLGESGGEFSQQQQQQHEYGGNPGPSSSVPYSNMPTRVLYGRTGGYGSSWPQNRGGERPPSSYDFLPPSSYDHHRYGGGEFFPPWEAYDFGENGFRDPSLLPPHQNPYLTSFGSYVPQFSSPAEDPVILWREYSKLRDKYNKLLQSVQETQRWSPADMNPEFQRQQEALRLCEIKLNDANITG